MTHKQRPLPNPICHLIVQQSRVKQARTLNTVRERDRHGDASKWRRRRHGGGSREQGRHAVVM
jgi:hypothetical protein